MSKPTVYQLLDQSVWLSPKERADLASLLLERVELDIDAGLQAHLLIEDVSYQRSIDRYGRNASNGEFLVFRFCSFDDLDRADPSISSTFLHCNFSNCEWNDAFFNVAEFVACNFTSCTFCVVAFANCLFVECTFTGCAFLPHSDGERTISECTFDGTRWYACSKDETTGLDAVS